MELGLEGKIAIIGGSSKGLGKACAMALAREGAEVAICARNEKELHDTADQIRWKYGTDVLAMTVDLTKYDDIKKLVNETMRRFGRIDILVNNAGITRDTLLLRMTEDQWDTVIAVNLKSVFNLTRAVIQTMLKQKSGSIINMSSVVGVSGNAAQTNYSASKAGIIGFTKSVAKEKCLVIKS